ncbi:hypothetical protein DQP56_02465 [Mycolicibacter senuensis]|nr:hypothetical protein DQP56_02465 [Mycolicibacter senuensis]
MQKCWILALFTELVRGVSLDRSPLGQMGDELRPRRMADFDELMPDEINADIYSLYRHVQGVLMPFIEVRMSAGTRVMSPDLGCQGLAADADLMVGTTLIEIKAVVGRRTRAGVPRYGLDARMLYQLVSYALLANCAGYEVDEIAIFNARYAHLESWHLATLLSELAGHSVTTKDIAAKFRAFIGTKYGKV